MGCIYPSGVISTDNTFLFNHDQIEKLFFIGYNDEEWEFFNSGLKNVVENLDDK